MSPHQNTFDVKATSYESWYQTPPGKYADSLEKELFLKLVQPEPGQKLVDIGCGTGDYLAFFQQSGLETTGIDVSEAMLAIASQKLGPGTRLCQGSAEKLPFDNDSFDIATLITTLEFVSDPLLALREAARVSRAIIFLGVLNNASPLALARRMKGKFHHSIYNLGSFYSIWDIKAMTREVIGNVPLVW